MKHDNIYWLLKWVIFFAVLTIPSYRSEIGANELYKKLYNQNMNIKQRISKLYHSEENYFFNL